MIMLQFNLLPDVKLQYIKTRRTQRLVTVISVIATVVALVVLGSLASVAFGTQPKNSSDLSRDIATYNGKLRAIPDLNKILTVQNQLGALTDLHDKKPAVTRLFSYVTTVTPQKAFINKLDVDYTQQTMSITGTADSLDTVNTFVDTLKFSTFSIKDDNESATKAFSNVVLSSFGRTQDGANYVITLSYDSSLFDVTKDVTVSVPSLVTTRSALEQPKVLFQEAPVLETNGGLQ